MKLVHAACREVSRCFIVIAMENVDDTVRRRPGRPLGFDREAALYQAMLLFWRHGYEATSVNDLIGAMGITPPSLYAAFGDKKQLFMEAVRRYLSGPVTSTSIIDQAPTAREAAAGLLNAAAVGYTGKHTPPGCLLASSAISCSAAAGDVREALAVIRRGIEQRLREKIIRERKVDRVEAEALAGHIMAVIQGMSTLARDGAKRKKLFAVADAAMTGWPAEGIAAGQPA